MKIRTYEFSDANDIYQKIDFGNTNLLVGSTGSGKSRFLQSIFRLGKFIATNTEGGAGRWVCSIETQNKQYTYSLETGIERTQTTVTSERLAETRGDDNIEILKRVGSETHFHGQKLPSLNASATLVNLMQGEPEVNPIFRGFQAIRQRNFSGLDNDKMRGIPVIPPEILAQFQREKNLYNPILAEYPLSGTLFIVKQCFPETFEKIERIFKSIFPQVESITEIKKSTLHQSINDPNIVVLGLKEKGITDPIPLPNISSGMLKTLLIISDIQTQAKGSIYLIDEYENSLGINAIDFLPDLLIESQSNIQFFITSHHPYLINKIPIKDWYVFARRGKNISVKFGEELQKRYGLSRQQAFTQLINDPFYKQGAL